MKMNKWGKLMSLTCMAIAFANSAWGNVLLFIEKRRH